MSSSAYLVYVQGRTLFDYDDTPARTPIKTEIIGYFRMDDGRIIAPREQEDFERLMKNPKATYIEEKHNN